MSDLIEIFITSHCSRGVNHSLEVSGNYYKKKSEISYALYPEITLKNEKSRKLNVEVRFIS